MKIPSSVALGLLVTAVSSQAAELRVDGRKFTVPDGFTVELAATSKLAPRPVSGSFDDRGRLYVTDSSGSNEPPSEQLKDPASRILRLEDTDGDGVFDKTVVFADKVMFPQGCLWHDGWVYAAAPPSIWRFRDDDGDGVADRREEWFKGGTLTGCANDIHGPYLGPDGYIYWTKGAFSEQTHKLGNGKTLNDKAAHIYRARPDGSDLDVIMSGGMDNPVEVAFTPEGEALFTSTFIDFSQPGFRDGIGHAVHGSVFGKVNDVLDDGRVKRPGPDLMHPFHQAGPAAECGLVRYESDVFGPGFRDNFFATTFNLHKVTRHVLRPDGATFASTDSDFLVCDDLDFHPTDVLPDADGSLLVVDTGGWYRLCCPSSQLAKPDVMGRIYRVRKTGAPKVADPWGLQLAWDAAAMAEAAPRLDDPRPAVREKAVTAFASMGTNAVPLLAPLLKDKSPSLRRNAIWALARIRDRSARRAALISLNDPDDGVVHAALKVISTLRDRSVLPKVTGLLAETNAPVLRAAVESFGRTASPGMAMMLFNVAQREDARPGGLDPTVEHSLIVALMDLGDPVATRLGLNHNRAVTRRAALIALDQMDGSDLKPTEVTPYLAEDDVRLRTAAAWILGRHPEWGEELAGWFRTKLSDPAIVAAKLAPLEAQLGMLTRAVAGQGLLADAVSQPAFRDPTRSAALAAIAGAGLKEPPAAWRKAVLGLLDPPSKDLAPAAVRAARGFGGDPALSKALLALARDSAQPGPLRLDALTAVPSGSALGAVEVEFLRGRLAPANEPVVRATAAGALARAKLDAAQLTALTVDLTSAGPLELDKLLGAFEGGGDDALGGKVVAALRDAKSAKALSAAQIKPRLAKFPAATREAADAFLTTLGIDPVKQASHLEKLLAEVQQAKGDVRRGQAVFNGPKAACSACHRIGYVGGNVGPELTKIGEVRSERDLLESIVYPSQSFVRSYEPMTVVTKDGEVSNGIVGRDTAEELVLVTGPGPEVHIAKAKIAEMRPGTLSVMPAGLDEQLTRQELADLLVFVKNVRWR